MSLQFSFDRYLNIRSAYAPTWLDNGKRVAFLTDITGTPQVWSVGAASGWPDQLTFFKEKVWTLKASPDGSRLVCSRDIGGNERYQLFLARGDGAEVRRISLDPEAIYQFGAWDRDGKSIAFTSNERNGVHFDIYVQEIDSGMTRRVLQTDGNYRVEAWSPGGRSLVLANWISSAHIPLYLLDLETGELEPLTSRGDPHVNLQVHWGGADQLTFLSNQGSEYLEVVRMDLETRERSYPCGRVPYDVEHLAVAPDSETLAYTVNIDGCSRLDICRLEGGETHGVAGLPEGVITDLAFSPDGGRLAVAAQSPSENLNVWVVGLEKAGASSRKLTQSSLGGIPGDVFITPTLVRYDTFDGRSIPAFFYHPRETAAPPPCILYVHGGPASQTLLDFDPRFQFFLNKGYAILAPNVRGSSGYGKTYMALDDVERRMDSVRDLKFAVDWLQDSGEVDPGKIAIYGRSYGGFMVLAAITTYPNLWAAAVDVVGIANWVTFLENTGPWRRAHREAEYGSLDDDHAFLESISPIHQVERIQCPLLVIHGANDPRVPVTEADQIVFSLRERDHPVEYLRYEDEGHKISKLENRIDSFTRMADFLARYLD